MSEEEKKAIEELINDCDNCPYNQCEQCEINWTQVQAIKKLKEELEQKQETIDKILKDLEEFYKKYDVISRDKIREYCKRELAFKNRLEREKQEISEYNKGRFDVYLNIIEELLGDDE